MSALTIGAAAVAAAPSRNRETFRDEDTSSHGAVTGGRRRTAEGHAATQKSPCSENSRTPEGISVRHRTDCRSHDGGKCNCNPAYHARIWDNAAKKRHAKTFPTLAAAKKWRRDAERDIENGTMRAPIPETFGKVAEDWLRGADEGKILNRSKQRYKASVLRSYRDSLRLHVLPALGNVRVSSITHFRLVELVDDLRAQGLSASSMRNAINPVRAIYRHLHERGKVAVNPTLGLKLDAVNSKRERIAEPDEAAALLAALAAEDRALWATAFYAGLRRGELRALRAEDVNSAVTLIHVRRGWDDVEGEIAPKSEKGTRRVPVPAVLRPYLQEHLQRTGRIGNALVFGRTATEPFTPSHIRRRAVKAWESAGLEPIGLHEARHTFASLMIAAGVNSKALSTYMGHASITITLDLYGHLFPGSENEDAALLDGYLARKGAERLPV